MSSEALVSRMAALGLAPHQVKWAANLLDPEAGSRLESVITLYKERAVNLNELADAVEPFVAEIRPTDEMLSTHLTDVARTALKVLRSKLAVVEWQKPALSLAIKETCTETGLKMPQVAIPLRVLLLGQPQSPAIDAVLEVMGRDLVLVRLDHHL